MPASLRRVWDFSAGGIRASLEESLERLGLSRVDVLYLHDPDEHDLTADLSTGVPALAALRDEGLVTAVGIGSKSTEALLAAVRTGALDLAMVAGRYTLLEQPALDEVVPACREPGSGSSRRRSSTPACCRSRARGPGPVRVRRRSGPSCSTARARIADVCERHGVTLPEAALQFPLREPAVRCVVVGGSTAASRSARTRERMRAEVPEALWDELAAEGLVRT